MYYFIVNPDAHCGQGEKIWRRLERRLLRSGTEYQVLMTEARGDACRFAEELSRNCREPRTIVIVGGDGTVNEVINGLSFSSRITVGYIPMGMGNDLSRGLKLPRSPYRCLKRIMNPRQFVELDYGILSYELEEPVHRRFAVSSGIGLDGAVCHNILTMGRKTRRIVGSFGRMFYILMGLKQLLVTKPASGYLLLDGVRRVEFNHIYFISSHIHPYEGGGFQFAPRADSSNGELEICVVHSTSRLRLLPVLTDAWFRKIGRHRGVRFFRCKEAQIHVNRPLPVHADGESCCCQTDIHLRCVSRKLRFIV